MGLMGEVRAVRGCSSSACPPAGPHPPSAQPSDRTGSLKLRLMESSYPAELSGSLYMQSKCTKPPSPAVRMSGPAQLGRARAICWHAPPSGGGHPQEECGCTNPIVNLPFAARLPSLGTPASHSAPSTTLRHPPVPTCYAQEKLGGSRELGGEEGAGQVLGHRAGAGGVARGLGRRQPLRRVCLPGRRPVQQVTRRGVRGCGHG